MSINPHYYRITSTRGQIHLSVKVNNVTVPIYAIHTESHQTEAWIPCESGQTFTVHLDCQEYPGSVDFRKQYQSLNAELRLDGVLAEELTSVYTGQPGNEVMGNVVWKGTYVRREYRRPFIFRTPELIDPSLTRPLGTIQVQVRRIQVEQPSHRPPNRKHFNRIWFDPQLPENAKKGILSNLTELGPSEPSFETLMYDIIGENAYDQKQPMATLTLRYATREVLMAKGIIPGAKKRKSVVIEDDVSASTVPSTSSSSSSSCGAVAGAASDEPVHLPNPPLPPPPTLTRQRQSDAKGHPLGRPSKRRRLYQAKRAVGLDQDGRDELERTARRLDEAFKRDKGWVDLTGGDSSEED